MIDDKCRVYFTLDLDQLNAFNEVKEKSGLKGSELAILLLNKIPELELTLKPKIELLKLKQLLEESDFESKIESKLRNYFMDLCKLSKMGISKYILCKKLDSLMEIFKLYERRFSEDDTITSQELLNKLSDLKDLIENDYETFKKRADQINFTLGIFDMVKILLEDKQEREFKKLKNETRKSIEHN